MFGFCGAFCIKFVFDQGAGNRSSAEGEDGTSVSLAVIMRLVGSIYIPMKDGKRVSQESKFEMSSTVEVFEDTF